VWVTSRGMHGSSRPSVERPNSPIAYPIRMMRLRRAGLVAPPRPEPPGIRGLTSGPPRSLRPRRRPLDTTPRLRLGHPLRLVSPNCDRSDRKDVVVLLTSYPCRSWRGDVVLATSPGRRFCLLRSGQKEGRSTCFVISTPIAIPPFLGYGERLVSNRVIRTREGLVSYGTRDLLHAWRFHAG
jgi:hypothetical protein